MVGALVTGTEGPGFKDRLRMQFFSKYLWSPSRKWVPDSRLAEEGECGDKKGGAVHLSHTFVGIS